MSPELVGGVSHGRHRVAYQISASELATQAAGLLEHGFRLALIAAHDMQEQFEVVYLFLAGQPDRRIELHVAVPSDRPHIPSLADVSFPASRFEREIADLFGITVTGHPAPKRLVKHAHWPEQWYPMRREAPDPPPFTDHAGYPFAPVEGTGVYEIPVGPIHAGLIEPGHFRFSVVGETIIKLTARLWFTHRGIEKLFEGRPALEATELAERISGDTSAAHALAHALAIEDALATTVSDDVHHLRALLVELERLYNHATDLGALANDVGYSIANIHAQRIREQLLRVNHEVTGHRLLRGAIRLGAVVLHRLPNPDQLAAIGDDLAEIARLTLHNSVVYDRFRGTATLTTDHARELGCLGYVARASGIASDARADHPTIDLPLTPRRATDGDVLARYTLRRDEFVASTALARYLIETAGHPDLAALARPSGADADRATTARSGVGIVEGWRGTIVHRVVIEPSGHISRAKIVDPSWFNWPALPVAVSDAIVPDFPLANKSFNLSYAGNDL